MNETHNNNTPQNSPQIEQFPWQSLPTIDEKFSNNFPTWPQVSHFSTHHTAVGKEALSSESTEGKPPTRGKLSGAPQLGNRLEKST